MDTRQDCETLLERQKGDDRLGDLVYIPAATEALTNRLANGICETDVGLGSNSQSAAVYRGAPLMAEQKESSVLFSLKELMNLEEDRIREEEAVKEAQAKAELEARQAAERTAREAEEKRLRAEEEARRAEEQRRREEEARVEAISKAELERARSEAEHKARMEAMAAQQMHEAQLAGLAHDVTKKRLKIGVGIAVGVLLVGGITGVALWQQAAEDAAKKAAAIEAQRRATQQELETLKRDFLAAQTKEEELRRTLESAKDDAERAKLEAQLAAAKQARQAAGRAISGGGRSKSKDRSAKKPCNCEPGDPLCTCL